MLAYAAIPLTCWLCALIVHRGSPCMGTKFKRWYTLAY